MPTEPITTMLASFRRFPWRDVPVYIAAQISGGVLGALAGGAALETPTPGGDLHRHGSDEDQGDRAPRP